MKKRKPGLAIAISLAAIGFVQAQQARPITLHEAIELGVKNSKQLKNSQAKIEEASAALKEARNNQLPDAKVTGAYTWVPSADVNLDLKSNTGGGAGTPKISQAVYGIVNASLPVYAGGRI